MSLARQISLSNKLHMAWMQHVYWTRLLIVSITQRLADQNATAARLLQNPNDIANIYAGYYPPDAVRTIAQLLTEHLEIGGALITALRDKDTAQQGVLGRRWYINADQMADAFSRLNPYYEREALRGMLYRHLELTSQEVAMRLAGDYAEEIEVFGEVEREAMEMADYFATGLMRQFPQKFAQTEHTHHSGM